jgi:6-phosphogluconolactonase
VRNSLNEEFEMVRTSHLLFVALLATSILLPARSQAETRGASTGAVLAMTNDVQHNAIITYMRNADGSLQQSGTFLTGGRGSGGVTDPLGSQGSLTLSQDGTWLFAVNAGSGNLSVFRVQGSKLSLVQKIACGGSAPISVAQHGSLVYVANEGAASSVSGFYLESTGKLKSIAGSTRFLSTGNSGASSMSFSPDGQFLLVTEKLTNNIDAFHVQADGTLGPIKTNPSAGPGLFALLFAPNGTALAVETGPAGGTNASAISSYSILANGVLTPISTSVPTLAAATCWHAITPNGQFVFTSNAGSATISGFAIGATGSLTPLPGTVVGTNPAGSTNLDIAISSDSKFLYTLDSGTGTVSIFAINSDGTLNNLGDAGGLSAAAGFNGIAAY